MINFNVNILSSINKFLASKSFEIQFIL